MNTSRILENFISIYVHLYLFIICEYILTYSMHSISFYFAFLFHVCKKHHTLAKIKLTTDLSISRSTDYV